VLTYPQEAKKFVHSLGETVLSDSPISFHRASISRLAALRSRALSLEKNFSIGFRSGEYDCSGRGDGFLDSRHLVTAEVAEDHGVSRLERWALEFTHLGQKHLAVHRPGAGKARRCLPSCRHTPRGWAPPSSHVACRLESLLSATIPGLNPDEAALPTPSLAESTGTRERETLVRSG